MMQHRTPCLALPRPAHPANATRPPLPHSLSRTHAHAHAPGLPAGRCCAAWLAPRCAPSSTKALPTSSPTLWWTRCARCARPTRCSTCTWWVGAGACRSRRCLSHAGPLRARSASSPPLPLPHSLPRHPAAAMHTLQVEIMHMRHKLDTDTRLIRGLVRRPCPPPASPACLLPLLTVGCTVCSIPGQSRRCAPCASSSFHSLC